MKNLCMALMAALALLACVDALAQPKLDAHTREDIARHRAMAQAHEEAARCLEAGKPESECVKALQARCKGLGIGKYCGMKHAH
jgi:hypothetical protein